MCMYVCMYVYCDCLCGIAPHHDFYYGECAIVCVFVSILCIYACMHTCAGVCEPLKRACVEEPNLCMCMIDD
jgi:hypothetical protein